MKMYPFIIDRFPLSPICLDHCNRLRFTRPFFLLHAVIFSAIFSHTLGTPRNMVGRTSLRLSPKEPFKQHHAVYTTCIFIIEATIKLTTQCSTYIISINQRNTRHIFTYFHINQLKNTASI